MQERYERTPSDIWNVDEETEWSSELTMLHVVKLRGDITIGSMMDTVRKYEIPSHAKFKSLSSTFVEINWETKS